jgi:hypothetical protein
MILGSSSLRRAAIGAGAVVALAAAPAALAARPAASPSGNPQTTTHPSTPPSSRGGPPQTDQGVVQSVSGGTLVLKALDGSTVNVPVDGATRVLVDGKLATLAGVDPGFVAIVKWKPGKAAQLLEAFDLSAKSGERLATVKAVQSHAVVVSGASGGSVTIHVNVRTHVFLDGKPSSLGNVATGDTLVVGPGTVPKAGRPALELRFLRPS